MADGGPAASGPVGHEAEAPGSAPAGIVESWRRLNAEQRVAGVGAVLLVVSTFGPFSFVEAAIILTGLGVLLLLRKRAERRRFHLPMGDGTLVLIAGSWSALLILTRILDRPLGQSILALGCAALLAAAGLRERAKRPADDVPEPDRGAPTPRPRRRGGRRGRPERQAEPATIRLAGGESSSEPDDPPEFRPS